MLHFAKVISHVREAAAKCLKNVATHWETNIKFAMSKVEPAFRSHLSDAGTDLANSNRIEKERAKVERLYVSNLQVKLYVKLAPLKLHAECELGCIVP